MLDGGAAATAFCALRSKRIRMRRHLGSILAVTLLALPMAAALAQKPPASPPPSAPNRAAPPPAERQLNLINRTDTAIRQVFVFAQGQAGRGEGPDRLGTDMLPAGQRYTLRLGRIAPCQQQLRAVWEDATEETLAIDVCRQQEFTLTDERRRDIQVVNDTDNQLMQIFIFERGSQEPGPDRLGAATVAPSDSFRLRLRGFAACQVTVRAAFQGAEAETRQADICAEPRLSFGDSSIPLREVTVTNRSAVTLQSLYASRTPNWGADRLGAAVLQPGQSFPLRVRSGECQFRLRAVFQNRREELREAVDMCGGQPIIFQGGRRMALGSVYERAITGIYLSPVESGDWGGNQISAPISNGGTAEISMDGECQADLRIVFDNNAAEELRGFDMCRNAAITLRPGWVTEARP
jgi:hypothetical protein